MKPETLKDIDCNCSDCYFLDRDLVKRQISVDKHFRWQKDYFDKKRIKILERSEWWRRKGDKDKAKLLLNEARNLQFQFDESECALHYGFCKKLLKEVSFIPNTCQIETQECFENRKSHTP